MVTEEDRLGIAGRGCAVHLRSGSKATRARHDMRVSMGKDQHVASNELDLILAAYPPVAPTFGQDVVGDQVLCCGEDSGCQLAGRRCIDTPGLRGLDPEEVRAVEADHAEQI